MISSEFQEQCREIAREVCRRRMAVPAVFFLESYKPLTGLVHSAAMAGLPVLLPLFGSSNVRAVMQLLESSENVECLIREIELADQVKEEVFVPKS